MRTAFSLLFSIVPRLNSEEAHRVLRREAVEAAKAIDFENQAHVVFFPNIPAGSPMDRGTEQDDAVAQRGVTQFIGEMLKTGRRGRSVKELEALAKKIDENTKRIQADLDASEGRFDLAIAPLRRQIDAKKAQLEQILNEV